MHNNIGFWFSNLSGRAKILTIIPVILLLLPKIDLIQIAGGSSLRIDDVVLLFVFISLVASYTNKRTHKISSFESSFFLFLAFICLSNIINIVFFSRSNFLFSIRHLQYFLFFYMGYLFARKKNIYDFFSLYLYITIVFVVLQKYGAPLHSIMPEFIHHYGIVSGMTSGPWEIGAVLNIIFATVAFDKKVKFQYFLKIFLITTIIILLSGSRSPLLAQALLFILYIYKKMPKKQKILFFVVAPAAIAISFFLFSFLNLTVKERSENLLDMENIVILKNYYEYIDVNEYEAGFNSSEIKESTDKDRGDLSWALRSYKWVYAIKLWLSNTTTVVFGVGSGTFGGAVDGGLVRSLTEFGILGFYLFFSMIFVAINKFKNQTLYIFTALLLNMLMIDVHIAYKVMSMFYFIIGIISWTEKNKS